MAKKQAIEQDKLGLKLEDLAIKMAEMLIGDQEVDKQMSDGFRALSTYFAQTRKLNIKKDDEDPDSPNFSNFKDRISKA